MKKPVLALAASVLLAGGIAAYLWLELRAEREQGGALAARVTALESAQRDAASVRQSPESRQPPPAALPAAATPQVAAAAVTPQAATAQNAGASAANAPANPMPAATQTRPSPDFARSMVRTMMQQMYPDVAKELGLTAAEADRLFDLISGDEDNLTADTLSMLSGKHTPDELREMQRRMLEKQRAQEEKVVALLGGRYPAWEAYKATAAARQQVSQLRTTLSSAGNPLSKAQEDALVTAFAAKQQRLAKEDRDFVNSPAALSSQNPLQESMQGALKAQREMVEAATPHLDATQLAQFRRQVDQQEKVLSATMGMMGVQRNAPGTP